MSAKTVMSGWVNSSKDLDVMAITHDVRRAVKDAGMSEGWILVSVMGADAGLVQLEVDEAGVESFRAELKKIMAGGRDSATISGRMLTSLMGKSLSLPVQSGEPMLTPWEKILLVDAADSGKRREFRVSVFPKTEAPKKGPPMMG